MFVIALETSAAGLAWSGRRHDDEESERTTGSSAQDLFDAVFQALHDGEQVAVGVDCCLTAPVPAGLTHLTRLLDELGTWRPWTTITTSPTRWLATQSILVWETPEGTPAEAAVRAFYDALAAPPM